MPHYGKRIESKQELLKQVVVCTWMQMNELFVSTAMGTWNGLRLINIIKSRQREFNIPIFPKNRKKKQKQKDGNKFLLNYNYLLTVLGER